VPDLTSETVRRVVPLVEAAAEGFLAGHEIPPDVSLRALGLGSMGFLRLIDALEAEFGIELDIAELSAQDTVIAIAGLVDARTQGSR